MSNKPGRHETSIGGLVGAMIVLVACVLAFVVFREMTREVPENKLEDVDWQSKAEFEWANGHRIAVPELPEDWRVVVAPRFVPRAKPTWDLSMLTGNEKFVGLYQSDERVADMVEERVDEDAEEGDPVQVDGGALAGEWDTFTDKGGDTAIVHEDENGVVMVYGRVSRDTLVDLASTIRLSPEG